MVRFLFQFVAAMAQFAFDKLQSCPDALNRTGFALSLGSLHRYVGSLGSGQHLDVSVKILVALAEDNRSPTVQVVFCYPYCFLLTVSLFARSLFPVIFRHGQH